MVVSPQPSTERYSPSERVVRVVAEEADIDPLDLPPLHNAIDTDALDTAVEGLSDGSVRFRYAERYVTISADGGIDVTEKSADELHRPDPAADD